MNAVVEPAGAQPVCWIGVLHELQRDWAHEGATAGTVAIGSDYGGSWSTEIALKQFASKGMRA